MSPQFATTPHGSRLAFHHTTGDSNTPGVMFLSGFNSNMNGSKALALEAYCKAQNISYTRFDYSGHGESSGKFTDGTIGLWLQDASYILNHITDKPIILVGSSMGGWLSLLLAIAQPARIHGLVLLAPAPDFTETLIWQQMNAETQAQFAKDGIYYAPSCYGEEPYPITIKLIEEGRNHVLLPPHNTKSIAINCPVRILHGMQDKDVPFTLSQALTQSITSQDIELTLIKNAGHRLSEPTQLVLMCQMVKGLI